MTKKELNKIRLEIFSDKSIAGVSFDTKNAGNPQPEINLTRSSCGKRDPAIKKIYLYGDFKSWDKLN